MKPFPNDFFPDPDDHAAVAMDVDDDSVDHFGGEGPLIDLERHRLVDADFFNSFQDDFDDTDIN